MKEIKLSWYELFLFLYLGRKATAEFLPREDDQKEMTKVCNLLEGLLDSNENADIFTIKPIEQ